MNGFSIFNTVIDSFSCGYCKWMILAHIVIILILRCLVCMHVPWKLIGELVQWIFLLLPSTKPTTQSQHCQLFIAVRWWHQIGYCISLSSSWVMVPFCALLISVIVMIHIHHWVVCILIYAFFSNENESSMLRSTLTNIWLFTRKYWKLPPF